MAASLRDDFSVNPPVIWPLSLNVLFSSGAELTFPLRMMAMYLSSSKEVSLDIRPCPSFSTLK